MNRATGFLWATAVALVLSASPIYAAKKVVKFPKRVFHAELQAQLDAQTVGVSSTEVPEQTISDRAGGRVVKFKPKAVAKVPKSTIARGVSRLAKLQPQRLIATTVLTLLIASIPGAEWDGYKARKKVSEGEPVPDTSFRWQGYAGGYMLIKGVSPYDVAHKAEVDWCASSPTYYSACSGSAAPQPDGSFLITVLYGYYGRTEKMTFFAFPVGKCTPPAKLVNGSCVTGEPTYADLTDADFDAMGNAFFGLDDAKMKSAYKELISIDPELGMYMPDYLTAPDGSFVQHMASPLETTTIARVNPDGSVQRLTRKEWADFNLQYSNNAPEINYTVNNNSQTLNEAGEKVEEETQTEQDEEVAPELSGALDAANDPLKDWGEQVAKGPSSTTAGIGYPLLFTYGGTCQPLQLTLAVYGSYTLTAICDGINSYVKPFLFVLFASWTVFHLFHIWRETTLMVRAA